MIDQASSLRAVAASRVNMARAARIVAVASGKGGVGKTFLTLNLAAAAARQGSRVLVIDADLGLANVALMLGLSGPRHLGDVLRGQASLYEAMIAGPAGVQILTSGNGVEELASLGCDARLRLLEVLEPLHSSFDVVLIDCGAGIGENVRFFSLAASEHVLVMTPEPASLADAYATIKVLGRQKADLVVNVIVNAAQSEDEARLHFDRLIGVAARFLATPVKWLGHVPMDVRVQRAIRTRKPILTEPRHAADEAIATIAARLWATTAPPDPGSRLLWASRHGRVAP